MFSRGEVDMELQCAICGKLKEVPPDLEEIIRLLAENQELAELSYVCVECSPSGYQREPGVA